MKSSPSQKAVVTGGAIIAFFVLLLMLNAFVVVEAGTVGVVTHFGAVQKEILPEGLHIVMPVRTTVVPLDVRVQKQEASCSASSKDLQVVTSKVALNFFLEKEHANVIFQELGPRYAYTIIEPTIQESVKSTTSLYTAEQLITQRQRVKEDMFKVIKKRLASNHIHVTDFSIINFNFSDEFNRAIEEKQVAEQAALRAKNDLVRIRTEAEQVRAKAAGEAGARLEIAKAEAESQKLLRETLDPMIIQLRAIEKWNGTLPAAMGDGGNGAFFDVVGALKEIKKKK